MDRFHDPKLNILRFNMKNVESFKYSILNGKYDLY